MPGTLGVDLTVIKINATTLPPERGDELAQRFAKRAGAVDGQDGFEGFELLRPTDDRATWLVVTRWRDDAAFNAWMSSPGFGAGHRSEATTARRSAESGTGGWPPCAFVERPSPNRTTFT